ncbi:MAG: response regulator [Oligoflexales bacterium]
MATILIADASKPSLVMTSEVFKDKIPGAIVLVSKSGKETIDLLATSKPDLCVVDFDLPDVDGPSLIDAMRKIYQGPILMTAFPGDIVNQAVADHLFTYADAGGWISKPVNTNDLNKKIDQFLVERHRLDRRFETNLISELVGKAAGRGKRAPKVKGKVLNISLGGACVTVEGSMKVKKLQEFVVSLAAAPAPKPAANKKKGAKASPPSTRKTLVADKDVATKIKAKVAWVNATKGTIGLQFDKLTDQQKKGLFSLMRESSVIE